MTATGGVQDARARLDAWFDRALDLEGAEREAFLAACEREQPGAAADLCELLALADDPSAGLQPPAQAEPRWRALFEALPRAREDEADAPLPARIGPWTPVAMLGRGGMGSVYRVERRDEGFVQAGALKLLRAGADSDDFLRRFAQERRILATLNHPGIARLLDGGRDREAGPYLVMEYVAGEPLDLHCDRRRLDIDARVAVFLQIAQAIAHAHRHLVAHRDLKPSNILVGEDGRVKVLDFGIAKVLSDDGIEAAPATRTATRMFTPDYATPEQVLGRTAAASADIYQLGLLLYELLCGHRAQRVEDPTQRALEAAICATPAVRPSERVGDGDLGLCAARATTPGALRRRLRGDLDNIVLMALRKEPERRYGSAEALIEDLERWRQGRPVRARPESLGYIGGKFIRRNAWAVAAGTALFALLTAYAVTATVQGRAIAEERDRARAEAIKARQTQALVLRLLEAADPERAGGAKLTARELIDRGWAEIEPALDGQPELQIELLDTVGEAYRKLGEFQRAGTLLTRQLALAEAMTPQRPEALARARRSNARLLLDVGRHADAEALLRLSLAGFEAAQPRDPVQIAHTLNDLGAAHERDGRLAQAESLYRRSLAMRLAARGERHPEVADALGDLGRVLRLRGEHTEAVRFFERALAMNRALLPAGHPELANSLSDLAWAHSGLGDHAAADGLYREALSTMRAAVGERHPAVALLLNNHAITLRDRGDTAQALRLLEEALDMRRETLGERHEMVALNLNDLGQLLYQTGDHAAAERRFRESLALYPPDHHWRGSTLYNLARLREAQGRWQEAAQGYRDAVRLQSASLGADHDLVAMGLNRLGVVLVRQGQTEAGEQQMRAALAIYRKRLPAGHERLATVLVPLGGALLESGRADEAAPLLREALQIRRRAFGEDDRRTQDVRDLIARLPATLRTTPARASTASAALGQPQSPRTITVTRRRLSTSSDSGLSSALSAST